MTTRNGFSLRAAVALAACCWVTTSADARAPYTVKAEDWLFVEQDEARLDALTAQAALRWNVVVDAATTRKFAEADARYRDFFGSMENVSGWLDIWKPGKTIALRRGRQTQSVEFFLQTRFRVRAHGLGQVRFAETRTLRCVRAAADKACQGLELDLWHKATVHSGLLAALPQHSVGLGCSVDGKEGAVNVNGRATRKCKKTEQRRPARLLESSGSQSKITRLRGVGDGVVMAADVTEGRKGDVTYFSYVLDPLWGTRVEHTASFRAAGEDTMSLAYAFLTSTPAKKLGEEPQFATKQNESVVNLRQPFRSEAFMLDYLCSETWRTCAKAHFLGWSRDADGSLRLTIDGCENDICFKGEIRGTYVAPRLHPGAQQAP